MKKLIFFLFLAVLFDTHCSEVPHAKRRLFTETPTTPSSTTSSGEYHSIYFVPRDNVLEKLLEFLDTAKNSVLVAIYWMTDPTVIGKLIKLKDREIDVKVIIDESSKDIESLITKFLEHGMLPLVYPSKYTGASMHDKFVVIDNADVFTGSSNFTKPGLRNSGNVNYENVVIIHSNTAAQQYREDFARMRTATLYLYVNMIAHLAPAEMPNWLNLLLNQLPKEWLKTALETKGHKFNSVQKARLQEFFE